MKILLLGKDGQVGWELQRALVPLGTLVAAGRHEANLENLDELSRYIRFHHPDIIVNAAAYTAVGKAESEPDKAQLINAEVVKVLAEEGRRLGAWLVHFSTDYVFDGDKSSPYAEDDATGPLSIYGKTKLAGEQAIRDACDWYLIFRTSWVYASRGGNFAKIMLRLAKEREQLRVVADQYGAPTSAELIADVTALAICRLAQTAETISLAGTYHLIASGETSWHGYAQYVLSLAQARGISLRTVPAVVEAISTAEYPTPAVRPRNSRLSAAKLTETFGFYLPDWRYHVQRLVDELVVRDTP